MDTTAVGREFILFCDQNLRYSKNHPRLAAVRLEEILDEAARALLIASLPARCSMLPRLRAGPRQFDPIERLLRNPFTEP
jgi:hypothetical protein